MGMHCRGAAIRIIFYPSAAMTGLMWLAVAVAPAAAETMPPQDWELAFEEDFRSLRLSDNASDGIWEPRFAWGSRTNDTNNELEYYVDPRPGHDQAAIQSLLPFTIDGSGLVIQARPIPGSDQPFAERLPYARTTDNVSQLFFWKCARRPIRVCLNRPMSTT